MHGTALTHPVMVAIGRLIGKVLHALHCLPKKELVLSHRDVFVETYLCDKLAAEELVTKLPPEELWNILAENFKQNFIP